MRLRRLGHSCVLLTEGDTRLLVDPGTFSAGFEELTGLTAVLVTHSHPDHLDLDRLPALLERNPDAAVVADSASAAALAEHGVDARVPAPGETVDLGLAVQALGGEHAVIHPDLPTLPNLGYLVGDRVLHPGDAHLVPGRPVAALCLPLAAPWSKASETVDYLRAVAPQVAVPVHDAVLAVPAPWLRLLDQLGPPGCRVEALGPDGELEVPAG